MAAAESTAGYGASIGHATTSNGTYTSVAQVRDITPPKVNVAKDDVSHMSSPNFTKEADAGWREVDDATFDLLYTKAQQAALWALIGTKKFWKVTDRDGSTEIFYGFISGIGREIPLEGRITASVTIANASDLPTFTPAA